MSCLVRILAVLTLAIALTAGSAHASLIEETAGVHYQDDAGTQHDAPDACDGLGAEFGVDINAPARTSGMLVPEDDVIDHFVLNVGAEHYLQRVFVSIRAADLNLFTLDVDVLLPGCGPSVFSEEGQARNQLNAPQPTEAPGPGEKTAAADSLTGYTCDPTEWHFLINQVGGRPAPDHIRVQWSNGEIENIPATQSTPATLAHYRSTANLDSQVWAAHVNIYDDWSGRFNLGSGPCNGPATPPPETFQPPVSNGSTGEFTVTEPEPHVLVAILRPIEPATSVPVDCHELCGPAMLFPQLVLGYGIGGDIFF